MKITRPLWSIFLFLGGWSHVLPAVFNMGGSNPAGVVGIQQHGMNMGGNPHNLQPGMNAQSLQGMNSQSLQPGMVGLQNSAQNPNYPQPRQQNQQWWRREAFWWWAVLQLPPGLSAAAARSFHWEYDWVLLVFSFFLKKIVFWNLGWKKRAAFFSCNL